MLIGVSGTVIVHEVTPADLGDYAVTVHGIEGSSFNIFACRVGKPAEQLKDTARKSDYVTVTSLNRNVELVDRRIEQAENLEYDNIAGILEKPELWNRAMVIPS
jgi:hypothetical protein